MIYTHVLNRGPAWGPEPRRPDVPLMGLRRLEYHPPGTGQISRDASPYIMAHRAGASCKPAER